MTKQSMNGSKPLKPDSQPLKELDPLDRARKAIEDGKAATKLLKYSDDYEETTKNETVVNLTMQGPNPPSPSQPQIDVSQKPGVLTIVLTTVQKFPAWGSVIVALAAIAAYVYLKTTGAIK